MVMTSSPTWPHRGLLVEDTGRVNPVFMAYMGLVLACTFIDLDFRFFLKNTMMRMAGMAEEDALATARPA